MQISLLEDPILDLYLSHFTRFLGEKKVSVIDSVLCEKIYPSSQALEQAQKISNRAVNQKMTENDNYFVSNSLNILPLK